MKDTYDFLKDEVAFTAEKIGPSWPQCEWFLEWLRNYISFDSLWTFSEAFGFFSGSVCSGTDAVHQTVLDHIVGRNDQTRLLMVFALATGWKNSTQAGLLMKQVAIEDPSLNVRRAALTALATNYRDADGTLDLLRDRAINDPDPTPEAEDYDWRNYVRRTANEAIARHWPDHPDTLKLLRERAENDPTEWLRRKAKELADSMEASG